MAMSGAGTSATPVETSSFHTALEECLPSGHDIALGDRSGVGSSMEQTSEYFSARVEMMMRTSEYFSPRVEEMMRSKSQFTSDVEHEIEHSRVHWSELSGLSDSLEEYNKEYYEETDGENLKFFAELRNDPQWRHHERGQFFREWGPGLTLGRRIAEGGQSQIFEVMLRDGNVRNDILLKVFKKGSRLSDLRKQWPSGILRREVLCITVVGSMLDDGRFVFLMIRCWGDLRKLIDQAMQEKNNQGPPFPYEWNGQTLHVKDIMRKIAIHMKSLHEQGVIHRDLKAANILLRKHDQVLQIIVADFECSIGVVGTQFWKAPEIFVALKNRRVIGFTEKMDIYSYGMTCFEVVTGRLPFEGELDYCRSSWDLIIAGQRPKLPSDLDLPLKGLIERCWNPIPNERPSFAELESILNSLD